MISIISQMLLIHKSMPTIEELFKKTSACYSDPSYCSNSNYSKQAWEK
jgi:hypothetical protein